MLVNETWALIDLLCMTATVVMSLILLAGVGCRKHDMKDAHETARDARVTKKCMAARLLSILPAAGAVIAFLLTEDLNNKMVLIDNRTIMMAAILMAQIVAALLAKRRCECTSKNHWVNDLY